MTILVAMTAPPARAIVIRHDRDDAQYLAAAASLPEPSGVGAAHGVVIAANWVLTAAHVAAGLDPLSDHVRVGHEKLAVRRIVLHPAWIGDLPPGFAEPEWVDLALIELSAPATSATPVPFYRRDDEQGRTVTLIGAGKSGDGRGGPARDDHRLRAATNVIDSVDARTVRFAFDAPPNALELEGIAGPGDSGGPALIRDDGQWYVAGIGSRNDGPERGLPECTYGTIEVYTRVSAFASWIDDVMASTAPPPESAVIDGWPATPAGRAAGAFFEAFNAPDDASLSTFVRTDCSEDALRKIPAEHHTAEWRRRRERWGRLSPIEFVSLTDFTLVALARSGDAWRSVRFELVGPAPHRVGDIRVARVPAPPPADSLTGLRDAVQSAETDGIDARVFPQLARRVVSYVERSPDRGDQLSALRLAGVLCWDGAPERTLRLRAWALAILAEHAAESDRARQMLAASFFPPLHRVAFPEQPGELERFEAAMREVAASVTERRILADLAFLPLDVRVAVGRTWDAPWFDEVARQQTIDRLSQLRDQFGDVTAADGRPYADVAADCVKELRELAFGQTLPEFSLQDIDGHTIAMDDYRGRVVLLVCWSSWCLPCMKAVPGEKAMVARLAGEPFVFLGVNGDAAREAAVKAARLTDMPWRSIWAGPGSGGARLVDHLCVRGWPSAFLLDGEGRIRAKFVGSAYRPTYTTHDVERAVRELLHAGGSTRESPQPSP